jgi:hypothetical protein
MFTSTTETSSQSTTVPGSVTTRAAQYVRMSTEHQKYSTENQGEAIQQYAARRGLTIVRTYADQGKSGLRLDGRDALKQLKGQMAVYPSGATGGIAAFPNVKDTKQYYNAIRALGLDLIGIEQNFETAQGEPPNGLWRQFEPTQKERKYEFRIVDTWGGIANACRECGKETAAELARHVAFSLRGSELKLRDCAREYAWQNEHAVFAKIREDGPFSNLKSFDLDLALHSTLVEMGTARDYLARFISAVIFREYNAVDAMSDLYRRAKSGALNNEEPTRKRLIDELLVICDKDHPDSWMARLGRYRNIIVHHAPIGSLAERDFLIAKRITTASTHLVRVVFPISADPLTPKSSDEVDALERVLELQRKLRDFARLVADCSGISPTLIHLTDKDILPDRPRQETKT